MTVPEIEVPLDWLPFQEPILEFLGYLLDQKDNQLDKGVDKDLRPVVLRPDSPYGKAAQCLVMALRNPEISDSEFWQTLQSLGDGLWFRIEPAKTRARFEPEWAHAKLYFVDEAEEDVRALLHRPRQDPLDEHWQFLLKNRTGCFEAPDVVGAWKRPALPAGFENLEALLSCWCCVGTILESVQNISWRQLSARCFRADSKFLDADSQQTLVHLLFPNLSAKIVARPILLHVYLPGRIREVLIVENQDTFTELAVRRPPHTALVFGMGYKTGAARVRQPGIPSFSLYGNSVEVERLALFEGWWTGVSMENWPVFFWGDLDYSGLDIASTLKKSFSNLTCWRPGYAPMLEILASGGGHSPEQMGKSRQRMLSQTGCNYADAFLLPALEKHLRFVDQEAVDISQIENEAFFTTFGDD